MGKKKIMPNMGDVYAIPLDNSRFCFGQIVTNTTIPYHVIFDLILIDYPDVEKIVQNNIIFLY